MIYNDLKGKCYIMTTLCGVCYGKFRPYTNNGGSLAAASGHDFTLLAADSQLVHGMTIASTVFERTSALGNLAALGTSGCVADCDSLSHDLRMEAERYFWGAEMSMEASVAAQVCSQMMYARRAFPYYASLLLCGLDRFGTGRVCVFDSFGSITEGQMVAVGSAQGVLQAVLDRFAPRYFPRFRCIDDAKEVLLSAFKVAARRDVSVGHFVDLTLVSRTEILCDTVLIRACD